MTEQANRLKLTEIFYSLQGESRTVGLPTVFVRLTGCPLRCQYCDTDYAFNGGQWWQFNDIINEIKQYQTPHITITGGEPLAQKNCIPLLRELCGLGYQVSLETSGAMDVSEVDPRVMKVMDIKTPGSKEAARNRWQNLDYLTLHDEVKFVICDEADYHWSKDIIKQHDLAAKAQILFSPSYQQITPAQLADWILRDRLPVRMQVQLHKIIWGDVPGK